MSIQFKDKIGALKTHPTKTYNRRALSAVEYIVVHHSAVIGGTIEGHAQYHVNTHGWPGIGYHFYLPKNGDINRTNYLDTLSYHVSNMNTKCVGILLEGDYMTENFSRSHPQFRGMEVLLPSLFLVFGGGVEVVGHGDLLPGYTCPGDNLRPFIREFDRIYRAEIGRQVTGGVSKRKGRHRAR